METELSKINLIDKALLLHSTNLMILRTMAKRRKNRIFLGKRLISQISTLMQTLTKKNKMKKNWKKMRKES